jgi:hypothetical protein
MLRWLAEEVRSALRRIRLGSISYKAVETKFRSKYGVTAKHNRKMFYRACKEVAPREVCDFIESRVKSLSVGDLHYDDQLSRADRAYPSIAEKVAVDVGASYKDTRAVGHCSRCARSMRMYVYSMTLTLWEARAEACMESRSIDTHGMRWERLKRYLMRC